MRTSDIWHSVHLHGKKIGCLLGLCLSLLVAPVVQAQEARNIRLLDYDQKDFHFGFTLGVLSNNLNLRHSEFLLLDPEVSDSTISISPSRQVSFSVGMLFNHSLADELWDLRIMPNVSFYNYQIDFFYPDTQVTQAVENSQTFMELPVLVKYASMRRTNQRFYLIGGFTVGCGVGRRQENEATSRDLRFERWNFEVTYGIGFSGYMQMFNFSPELRFSHGLVNMMADQNNIYANNLDRITTHKVGLYFNFEG